MNGLKRRLFSNSYNWCITRWAKFSIKIQGKYPKDECIFDSENWCRYRSTSTKSSSCSILLRLWSAISVLWLIFLPLKMAAISADFFIDMTVCSSLELLLFGVLLLWRLLSDWWCWWCCLPPLDSDLLLDDWELPEYIIWNWTKKSCKMWKMSVFLEPQWYFEGIQTA